MGQSVHATGFRLGKLKNWGTRSCVPEKERYVGFLRREWLIERYLVNFFDNVLPKRVKKRIKKGKKEARRAAKVQAYVRKEAYKVLKKKWDEGTIGQFEEKEKPKGRKALKKKLKSSQIKKKKDERGKK